MARSTISASLALTPSVNLKKGQICNVGARSQALLLRLLTLDMEIKLIFVCLYARTCMEMYEGVSVSVCM